MIKISAGHIANALFGGLSHVLKHRYKNKFRRKNWVKAALTASGEEFRKYLVIVPHDREVDTGVMPSGEYTFKFEKYWEE